MTVELAGFATLFLYPMLTTAAYYLGARARITQAIWSRYPRWLDYYTLCAACSGFAYGAGAAGIGWYLDAPFLVLPGRFWLTPIVVGLCSVVWTPVLAARHLAALESTSPPPSAPAPTPDDGPDVSGQPGAFAAKAAATTPPGDAS